MSNDLVQLLDRMAVSNDPFLLFDLADEVAAFGSEAARPAAERLTGASDEAREALLRAIGAIGDSSVGDALMGVWQDASEDDLRLSIEWTLAMIGAKDLAIDLCLRSITERQSELAPAEMALAADLGRDEVLPRLEATVAKRPELDDQLEVAKLLCASGFAAVVRAHREPTGSYDPMSVGIQIYNSLPRPEVLQVIKEDLQSPDPSAVVSAADQISQGTMPREMIDAEVKETLIDLLEQVDVFEIRVDFLGALAVALGPGDQKYLARLQKFSAEKPYRSKLKFWRSGEYDATDRALADVLRVIERRVNAAV